MRTSYPTVQLPLVGFAQFAFPHAHDGHELIDVARFTENQEANGPHRLTVYHGCP